MFRYYENVAPWFGNILANPHLIILVIIMIVLILESVNVIRKGNRAEKKESDEEATKNISTQADDPHAKHGKDIRFSYFEPFKGIIIAIVVTVLFLASPQIIAYVFVDRLIPTFITSAVRSLWIPIILWALIRIGIEVAYIIERHYTKRLAMITVIGNVLATICGIIIFISPRIVNGEYIDFIHRYFEDMAAWFSVPLTRILDRPNLIILVIMIVVFIVESINMIRRGNKTEDEDEVDNDVITIKNDSEDV